MISTLSTRDWTVNAEDVKPGELYRDLGSGFLARTVNTVVVQCNCEGRTRSIDPVTRGPLHFVVVVITADGLTATRRLGSKVTLTDGY